MESNLGLIGLNNLSFVRLCQSKNCVQKCDAVERKSESKNKVKSTDFVDVVGQEDPEGKW